PASTRFSRPEKLSSAGEPAGQDGVFVEVEPRGVSFANEFARVAGGGVGAEEEGRLLCAVHDGEAKRIARFAPDHPREIRERDRVPINPARRAAGAGDNAEADHSIA